MLAVLLSSICYRHNNDNVKCKCCWLVCFEAITSQQRKLRSYNRIFFFSHETESCYKCSILILYFFYPMHFCLRICWTICSCLNICCSFCISCAIYASDGNNFFPPKHCMLSLLVSNTVKFILKCQSQLCLS